MTDPLTALEQVSEDVSKLEEAVNAAPGRSVEPKQVKAIIRRISITYLESLPGVLHERRRDDLVVKFKGLVTTLYQFSNAPRSKQVYRSVVSDFRQSIPEAIVSVLQDRLVLSPAERHIIDTLQQMLPAAAASYEQALRDIASGDRVSWRGTGSELREVLRELMDHLAPTDKVMAQAGFRLEPDQTRPTQKQKVKYILKARRRSVETAQHTLDAVDEMVAALARSTYSRGSAGAHSSTDGREVRHLKGYVDALLIDLLEITE